MRTPRAVFGPVDHAVLFIVLVEEEAKTVVHYTTTDPPSGGMVLTALTQPLDIVAIPRTTRPVDFVGRAAAPPAPKPTVIYMLTFADGVTKADVMQVVAQCPIVRETKLLGIGIGFAHVDTAVDAASAIATLSAIEGVQSVERDG